MRPLVVRIPSHAFALLMLLIAGCGVTGTYDDRMHLGGGVVYLSGNEIEDYTCGNWLMTCDSVGGFTRRCRCVQEQRLGER